MSLPTVEKAEQDLSDIIEKHDLTLLHLNQLKADSTKMKSEINTNRAEIELIKQRITNHTKEFEELNAELEKIIQQKSQFNFTFQKIERQIEKNLNTLTINKKENQEDQDNNSEVIDQEIAKLEAEKAELEIIIEENNTKINNLLETKLSNL